MATVLLLASRQPERVVTWLGALTAAMAVSGAVLPGSRSAAQAARLVDGFGDRKADGSGTHRGGGGDDPGRPEALFLRA